MNQFTQENRLLSVSDFGLGKDTFLLTDFSGDEHVSNLFQFQLEMLSEDLEVSPEKIIGKPVIVNIHNGKERMFSGYISDFAFGEIEADNLRAYKMTMVPWLWFLTKTNNHRIFQHKTAKDIVSQVFDDLGFKDYDFRARGGEAREYCIQHNESDFHFVSRLLEEEGIAYYFNHEEDKHQLILVDEKHAYEAVVEVEVEYSKGNTPNSQIHSWEHQYQMRKGQWSLNDYDFKQPTKDLLANIQSNSNFANNETLEHYEYPGLYESGLGDHLVRVRMEAEELPRNIVKGDSDCCTFMAGGQFTLTKHTHKQEKGDYVLLSVSHKASEHSYYSGEDNGNSYQNHFTCIPSDVHFRPAQKHQRPVMKGPQTAVVVGPKSEEIYIDEYGRIKVQFIWDREGKMNENSSCWLRVMQVWAGNKWGASFIPRIGHEVIVDFLDGDPDRPIVSGTVYNEKNKPPYESKTQSGIKSRSTKGGTPSNFNEIRFEDKKGAEDLFIQAEKTYTLNVKGDSGGTIAGNANGAVAGNADNSVGGNESAAVGGNRNASVGGNESNNVAANKSSAVGGNETQSVGGALMSSVGGLAKSLIGGPKIENISGPANQIVASSSAEQVAAVKSITAGASIMLKCGGASITLNSGGNIEINGTNITVNGTVVGLSGSSLVNVKAGAVASVQGGSAVAINGAGMVAVKGGRIDLN